MATPPDRHNVLFAVVIFVIYSLSLVAGIALALGHKFGRVASIIIQGIQLPKYSSQFLVFMFSFGFDAYPYAMLNNNAFLAVGVNFKFLAYNQLFTNVAEAPAGFGFSIPACVFLVMLLRKPQPATSGDTLSAQL